MNEQDVPSPAEEQSLAVDSTRLNALLQRWRDEQQLGLGLLAGLAAALVGAALWALVTVLTGYQIGFMAVAIGYFVGYAVRRLGKGIDTIFGVMGAALALLGCLLGNLLALVGLLAKHEGIPFMVLLSGLDLKIIPDLMRAGFSFFDLLFYGIAVYEGYKLSFRRIDAGEVEDLAPDQY